MSSQVVFDSTIEDRIKNEILTNAYNEHEIAMRWVAYLEDQLAFPFVARCIQKIDSSPLALIDVVTVKGFNRKCSEHDMFVDVEWQDQIVTVPLSQLDWLDADETTIQALAHWCYWAQNGCNF